MLLLVLVLISTVVLSYSKVIPITTFFSPQKKKEGSEMMMDQVYNYRFGSRDSENSYCETVDTPQYCKEPNTRAVFDIPVDRPHWDISGKVGEERSLQITARTCEIYSHGVFFCTDRIDPSSEVYSPRCVENEYSEFDSIPVVEYDHAGGQYFQKVPFVKQPSSYWSEGKVEEHDSYTWDPPFENDCNRITEIFSSSYADLKKVFGYRQEDVKDGTLEIVDVNFKGFCEGAPTTVEHFNVDEACQNLFFRMTTLTTNKGTNTTIMNQGYQSQVLSKQRAIILIPISLPLGQEFQGFRIILDEEDDPLRFMIQSIFIHGPTRNYINVLLVNTSPEEISSDSGSLRYEITTTTQGLFISETQELSTKYHVEFHGDQKDFFSYAQEYVFSKPEEAFNSYIIGQPIAGGGKYFVITYYPKSKWEDYEFLEEHEPVVEFLMKDGERHRIPPGYENGLKFTKLLMTDPMWGKLDKTHFDCVTNLCTGWYMELDEDRWKVKWTNGEKPLKVVVTGNNKIKVVGGRRSILGVEEEESKIEESETTFYTPDEKKKSLVWAILTPSIVVVGCCCCTICFLACCLIFCIVVSSCICGTGGCAMGAPPTAKTAINISTDEYQELSDRENLLRMKKEDGDYKSTSPNKVERDDV